MTLLPYTSQIENDAIRGNFEAIENTTGLVARAYRGTAFSLKAATLERIPLDKASFSPASFDLVNGFYRVSEAGFYLVCGCVAFQITPEACTFIASIVVNGVEVSRPSRTLETGSEPDLAVSDIVQCKKGDTIELWAYCGVAKALLIASTVNFLTVMKIP